MCAIIRYVHLIPLVGVFLITFVVVGCVGSGTEDVLRRDGEHDAAATSEETTASRVDRSAAKSTQEPVGMDAKVVSPVGQANLPAGFGEGSLWATD